MPIEKFDLVLDDTTEMGPGALHMQFSRADGKPLESIPGQFVTLLLTGDNGRLKRRSYSVSSIPGQSEGIEIALTYVEGGLATEKLFNMQLGDSVSAMGPAGRLLMREDVGKTRYVLVATSTGVSPYRAMLPDIAKRMTAQPDFCIDLLLGVQYRENLLYERDFINFAKQHDRFRFHAYLSREDLSQDRREFEAQGYVQHGFKDLALDPSKDIVYLCGNPNMIDEAYAMLQDSGFTVENVRREKYISSR